MATRMRPYQRAALEALHDFFDNQEGHPLVVAATGAGKSVLLAGFMKEQIAKIPDLRICMLAHQSELISQNYSAIVRNWPTAPVGIYSASLNKRSRSDQILCCGIQSVWNKTDAIGEFDVLLIDEAHMIPRKSSTRYAAFILEQIRRRPWCRVVGFTATPQRMDSGSLVEGEDRLFDVIVYDIDVATLIAEGYLTPLSSKPTTFQIELKAKRNNGEWSTEAVAKEVDKEDITRAAVQETIEFARTYDSKCALIFCAGVDHAHHVADEVRQYQFTCETIHGGTPKSERRNTLERLKTGKLWGITNDSVLTTGVDVPTIDLIVMLRPTGSTVLYQQILGRGLRPIYPRGFIPDDHTAEERREAIRGGPKPLCRVLDFAGNIDRHGPVDDIHVREKGERMPGENGTPAAPMKVCPGCDNRVSIQTQVCPECSHEFERDDKPKHDTTASTSSIMKGEQAIASDTKWFNVESMQVEVYRKEGRQPSLKLTYKTDGPTINEWLGWYDDGKPSRSLADFWKEAMPGFDVPSSARDANLLLTNMVEISTVAARKNDRKYWEIRTRIPAAKGVHVPSFIVCHVCHATNPKSDPCPCGGKTKSALKWNHEWDEDIPF